MSNEVAQMAEKQGKAAGSLIGEEVKSPRFNYYGHDAGLVVTQPRSGQFEERPMTPAELAAREPAREISVDIYRHANRAGVCYYEIWTIIAAALQKALDGTPCPQGPHQVVEGCVFCRLEDANEQARVAHQSLREHRDNNAIVAKVLQDVCDLPYDSPDDDPLLLQCTSNELETILRRALGEDV